MHLSRAMMLAFCQYIMKTVFVISFFFVLVQELEWSWVNFGIFFSSLLCGIGLIIGVVKVSNVGHTMGKMFVIPLYIQKSFLANWVATW